MNILQYIKTLTEFTECVTSFSKRDGILLELLEKIYKKNQGSRKNQKKGVFTVKHF